MTLSSFFFCLTSQFLMVLYQQMGFAQISSPDFVTHLSPPALRGKFTIVSTINVFNHQCLQSKGQLLIRKNKKYQSNDHHSYIVGAFISDQIHIWSSVKSNVFIHWHDFCFFLLKSQSVWCLNQWNIAKKRAILVEVDEAQLPSGKHLHNYGKIHHAI